jgi:hypothetical protein
VSKDPAYWDVITNSASSPANAYSGNNAIHMSFSFSTLTNDWLVSPVLNLKKNHQYVLSFFVKTVKFSGATSEKFKIHLGKDTTEAALLAGNKIFDKVIENDVYEEQSIIFQTSQDGKFYLGFHSYSDPLQFLLLVDDIEVIDDTPVSTEDVDNQFFVHIFPNPTSDVLNVKSAVKAKVEVYDFQGQSQLKQAIVEGNNPISTADFPNGTYFLTVIDEKGRKSIRKFQKN